MNQIKQIYATEVNLVQKNSLKQSCNNFKYGLDKHINQVSAIKKKDLVRQSLEYHEKISKITDQSNHYKKRIFQQQKQFEQKIENYLKYDVSKWKDYQLFFKSYFDDLEEKIYHQRNENAQYRKRIQKRKQDLKNLIRSKWQNEINVCQSQGGYKVKKTNIETRQSTIRLSYSLSKSKRVKTESSLPSLKLGDRYERIKTIQSDYEAQKGEINKNQNRGNYMEPIRLFRTKKQSSLPLLMEFLKYHKSNHYDMDNWFLKVIYNARNFNKILNFINKNSPSKKIAVKN